MPDSVRAPRPRAGRGNCPRMVVAECAQPSKRIALGVWSGGGRVVALFCTSGCIGRRHAYDDPPPSAIALGIPRAVAERVLTGQFVGNLTIHAGQLGDLPGEKYPSSGLLGQLAQHELRIAEPAAPFVARPEPNGVDGGLGALREIQHLVEADEARRVLAIGEHDY